MSTGSQPKIACPHCQALIKLPALPAGSLVNCPKCGQVFRVRGEEADLGTNSEVQRPKAGAQGPKPKAQSPKGVASVASTPAGGVPPPVSEERRPRFLPATRLPQPPVPQPPPVREPVSVVPQDFGSAAKATEPAHRPPSAPPAPALAIPKSQISNPIAPPVQRSVKEDGLVDPNLLPPPPPRTKPKPTEVTVICTVCGTRMHAPLSKIGQTMKCPDCHSVCTIKAPEERGEVGAPGPTLEDAEEFALTDPGERPRYRPLVAPRGEYEILSALDPATVTHGWSLPDKATATGEDEEIHLAPPVERIEIKPEPIKLPVPDPEEALYDGRYDDGLIGDNVDPREPDAWKRAPFVYGILEFLFYSSTLLRWIVFAAGLTGVAILVRLDLHYASQPDGLSQGLAAMMVFAVVPAGAVWLISFFAAAFAIVQSTANGEKEGTSWPDWNAFEWFSGALHLLLATLYAGLPGGMLAAATLAASADNPLMAAFGVAAPPVLSWMVLFPMVLYSMLAEDSLMAITSPHTLRSLKRATDGWVFFYMYSILIMLFGAAAASLMLLDSVIAQAVGALGAVGLMIVYFRLLGRLMWYAAQREAKLASS